jgi:phosphoadenosine phosphosulfate reductase
VFILLDKVKHSKGIIRDAVQKFRKIAVATSYGKDSVVLLHLCKEIDPNFTVFNVITRYKPRETLDIKHHIETKWSTLQYHTFSFDKPINENLHKLDPNRCCELLKILPTKRAITELELDAWITGLRHDEGETRRDYAYFEKYNCGLWKVNPLLEWSEIDIWRYTAYHKLPVNELYLEGYRSLGCLKCSKPNSETERGGRWEGTSKVGGECGIHSTMYRLERSTPNL